MRSPRDLFDETGDLRDEQEVPANLLLVGCLVNNLPLSPFAYRVWLCLKAHCGFKGGKCYPGFRTIENECGISRTGLLTALKELETHGVLEITRRIKGAKRLVNVYTLKKSSNWHLCAKNDCKQCARFSEGSGLSGIPQRSFRNTALDRKAVFQNDHNTRSENEIKNTRESADAEAASRQNGESVAGANSLSQSKTEEPDKGVFPHQRTNGISRDARSSRTGKKQNGQTGGGSKNGSPRRGAKAKRGSTKFRAPSVEQMIAFGAEHGVSEQDCRDHHAELAAEDWQAWRREWKGSLLRAKSGGWLTSARRANGQKDFRRGFTKVRLSVAEIASHHNELRKAYDPSHTAEKVEDCEECAAEYMRAVNAERCC
jgi:hypothetical protein